MDAAESESSSQPSVVNAFSAMDLQSQSLSSPAASPHHQDDDAMQAALPLSTTRQRPSTRSSTRATGRVVAPPRTGSRRHDVHLSAIFVPLILDILGIIQQYPQYQNSIAAIRQAFGIQNWAHIVQLYRADFNARGINAANLQQHHHIHIQHGGYISQANQERLLGPEGHLGNSTIDPQTYYVQVAAAAEVAMIQMQPR